MTFPAIIQSLAIQGDGSANAVLSLSTGSQLLVNVPTSDFESWPLGGTKTVTVS